MSSPKPLVIASFVLATLVLGCGSALPQSPPQEYEQREPAQTMSYRGASWLERSERVAEERPDDVIAAMQLQPGDVVADIGVGSGYFARRIARIVGPEGKVFGVDIQPQMLEILEDRAREEGISNIEPVLGDPDDPNLPPESVDWMILVDVYHEISDPGPMLARMYEALKPGGRVALLEYRLEDASGDHIFPDHRMSARQVLREWKAADFELVELLEFLPSQHMFILGKGGSDARLRDRDLVDAAAEGLVEFEARGGGRNAVEIEVRRLVEEELLLTVAAGTRFDAGDGHRDMVAVRDGYKLLDESQGTLRVRAAGTHWEPQPPGPDVPLLVRAADPDDPVTAVARALQSGTYRMQPGARFASYAPQSVGTSEAALWMAMHDPGFDDIEDHLGDPEVPGLYAAAFGLVACDKAGIDITELRMWRARSGIFRRLEVNDLQAWYSNR